MSVVGNEAGLILTEFLTELHNLLALVHFTKALWMIGRSPSMPAHYPSNQFTSWHSALAAESWASKVHVFSAKVRYRSVFGERNKHSTSSAQHCRPTAGFIGLDAIAIILIQIQPRQCRGRRVQTLPGRSARCVPQHATRAEDSERPIMTHSKHQHRVANEARSPRTPSHQELRQRLQLFRQPKTTTSSSLMVTITATVIVHQPRVTEI
jgi:hypothetical protein